MFQNIVAYHVYQTPPLPPNDTVAYQYILASTSVYLRAENPFFDVLLPITRCQICGLAPHKPHLRLKVARLPSRLLAAVLSDARRTLRERRAQGSALSFQTCP